MTNNCFISSAIPFLKFENKINKNASFHVLTNMLGPPI